MNPTEGEKKMQLAEYQRLKKKIPDFDKRYTKKIKISSLQWDDVTSQIRKGGHVIEKVPEMARDLEQNGQQAPTSHRVLPNNKPELYEGATRVLGLIANKEEYVWSSSYHGSLGWTDQEVYDWQCTQNQHPTATNNSTEDIKHQVAKRYENGWLDNEAGFPYRGNEEAWVKKVVSYLRGLYGKSRLKKSTAVSYVKKALTTTIGEDWQNYTKATAMTKFENQCRNLNIDWNHDKRGTGMTGEVSNNKTFYPAGKVAELKTNITGNGVWKAKQNPGISIGVVCWQGDLLGATPEKLFAYYDKMKATFVDLRGTDGKFFKGHFTGGLWAVPQIKTGPYAQNLHEVINLLAWENPLRSEE